MSDFNHTDHSTTTIAKHLDTEDLNFHGLKQSSLH
ncbi:Uncharacterised protein [Staphylococcus aureus]|uniref:Uncharacterized protein n=1 Tax=Staphylococcus aureus TaxID=1280 RepID=A0A380DWR9_STAAU|nr:Uncharacterised protein [Staphylococcus aureus]